jgi:hypothetical protein
MEFKYGRGKGKVVTHCSYAWLELLPKRKKGIHYLLSIYMEKKNLSINREVLS